MSSSQSVRPEIEEREERKDIMNDTRTQRQKEAI